MSYISAKGTRLYVMLGVNFVKIADVTDIAIVNNANALAKLDTYADTAERYAVTSTATSPALDLALNYTPAQADILLNIAHEQMLLKYKLVLSNASEREYWAYLIPKTTQIKNGDIVKAQYSMQPSLPPVNTNDGGSNTCDHSTPSCIINQSGSMGCNYEGLVGDGLIMVHPTAPPNLDRIFRAQIGVGSLYPVHINMLIRCRGGVWSYAYMPPALGGDIINVSVQDAGTFDFGATVDYISVGAELTTAFRATATELIMSVNNADVYSVSYDFNADPCYRNHGLLNYYGFTAFVEHEGVTVNYDYYNLNYLWVPTGTCAVPTDGGGGAISELITAPVKIKPAMPLTKLEHNNVVVDNNYINALSAYTRPLVILAGNVNNNSVIVYVFFGVAIPHSIHPVTGLIVNNNIISKGFVDVVDYQTAGFTLHSGVLSYSYYLSAELHADISPKALYLRREVSVPINVYESLGYEGGMQAKLDYAYAQVLDDYLITDQHGNNLSISINANTNKFEFYGAYYT